MKYTAFCIDTGNYECREIPQVQSTRVYRMRVENGAQATFFASEFLIEEFGEDGIEEWRIFITNSDATFFSGGVRIPVVDKVS